jgi:TldD protein
MTGEIERPEKFFLEKFGLTGQTLERTLGAALGRRIDYADLYFEYRVNEEIGLEEGIVKKAAKSISQGVGVRATAEEKTGFAYSDEITVENLQLAAQRARYIAADSGQSDAVAVSESRVPSRDLYPVQVPPTDVPIQTKVDLLHQIDRIARAYDPRITKVMATVASEQKLVLVATSEGWVVGDVRPLHRLQVTCIAEDPRRGPGARQVGTARARRPSAAAWASGSLRLSARWWTTGRYPPGGAPSTWTTRGRRRGATSSSRTAS